jgi:hypothetical protein
MTFFPNLFLVETRCGAARLNRILVSLVSSLAAGPWM